MGHLYRKKSVYHLTVFIYASQEKKVVFIVSLYKVQSIVNAYLLHKSTAGFILTLLILETKQKNAHILT